MRNAIFYALVAAALACFALFAITPHAGPGTNRPAFIVLAWNDTGTYGAAPGSPCNCLWAQVIKRGDPPRVVADGVTVEYRITGSTGSGRMRRNGDHFKAGGLPVSSIKWGDKWNPYQLAEVTVRDPLGNVLAGTQTAVPTSDELALNIGRGQTYQCSGCHGGVPDSCTEEARFTTARGHGGLYCPVCHDSPHALLPSRAASGNYQAMQYQPPRRQGRLAAISSCAACHETSRGPSIGRSGSMKKFVSAHGGTGPKTISGCNICHTAFSPETRKWPHAFAWKDR